MNQRFPNDQSMMFKKLHMTKRVIQSTRQTKGFYVTEYIKFIDMASECTLQLTFKTKITSLSSNGESKNIHN